MSVCLTIKNNGSINLAGASDPCDLVAMTAQELTNLQAAIGSDNDLLTMLNSIFAQPDQAQIISAFMAAFTLPIICYMVAYGLGVVVNFFR